MKYEEAVAWFNDKNREVKVPVLLLEEVRDILARLAESEDSTEGRHLIHALNFLIEDAPHNLHKVNALGSYYPVHPDDAKKLFSVKYE